MLCNLLCHDISPRQYFALFPGNDDPSFDRREHSNASYITMRESNCPEPAVPLALCVIKAPSPASSRSPFKRVAIVPCLDIDESWHVPVQLQHFRGVTHLACLGSIEAHEFLLDQFRQRRIDSFHPGFIKWSNGRCAVCMNRQDTKQSTSALASNNITGVHWSPPGEFEEGKDARSRFLPKMRQPSKSLERVN